MKKTTNEMPHNGSRLKRYLRDADKKSTVVSKQMGYSAPLLMRLFDTPSIRTHIWWQLGIILDRNLFAEFAEIFPVKYKSEREQQLEDELKDVKKELEIYRRILDKHLPAG